MQKITAIVIVNAETGAVTGWKLRDGTAKDIIRNTNSQHFPPEGVEFTIHSKELSYPDGDNDYRKLQYMVLRKWLVTFGIEAYHG